MIPIVQCTYVISTHANERVDVEWIHYLLPSHVCMVMSYKNILGVPLLSLRSSPGAIRDQRVEGRKLQHQWLNSLSK